MEERYELARERIRDIAENEKESKYCQKIARFFMLVFAVYERRKKGKQMERHNYAGIGFYFYASRITDCNELL